METSVKGEASISNFNLINQIGIRVVEHEESVTFGLRVWWSWRHRPEPRYMLVRDHCGRCRVTAPPEPFDMLVRRRISSVLSCVAR